MKRMIMSFTSRFRSSIHLHPGVTVMTCVLIFCINVQDIRAKPLQELNISMSNVGTAPAKGGNTYRVLVIPATDPYKPSDQVQQEGTTLQLPSNNTAFLETISDTFVQPAPEANTTAGTPGLEQALTGHLTSVQSTGPGADNDNGQGGELRIKFTGYSENMDRMQNGSDFKLVQGSKRQELREQRGNNESTGKQWNGSSPAERPWSDEEKLRERSGASELKPPKEVMGSLDEELSEKIARAPVKETYNQLMDTPAVDQSKRIMGSSNVEHSKEKMEILQEGLLERTARTKEPPEKMKAVLVPDIPSEIMKAREMESPKTVMEFLNEDLSRKTSRTPTAKKSNEVMVDPSRRINGASEAKQSKIVLDTPKEKSSTVPVGPLNAESSTEIRRTVQVNSSSETKGVQHTASYRVYSSDHSMDSTATPSSTQPLMNSGEKNSNNKAQVSVEIDQAISKSKSEHPRGRYLLADVVADESKGNLSLTDLTAMVRAESVRSGKRSRRDSDMEDDEDEMKDDSTDQITDHGSAGEVKDNEEGDEVLLTGGFDNFLTMAADAGSRGLSPREEKIRNDLEKTLVKANADMKELGDLILDTLPNKLTKGDPRYGLEPLYSSSESVGLDEKLPESGKNPLVREKKDGTSNVLGELHDNGPGGDESLGLGKLSALNNKLGELIQEGEQDQRLVEKQQTYRKKREADPYDNGDDNMNENKLDLAEFNDNVYNEEEKLEDGFEDSGYDEKKDGGDNDGNDLNGEEESRSRGKRNVSVDQNGGIRHNNMSHSDHPKDKTHTKFESDEHDDGSPSDEEKIKTDDSDIKAENLDDAGEKESEEKKKKSVKVTGMGYILFNSDGIIQAEKRGASQTLNQAELEKKSADLSRGRGETDQVKQLHHQRHHSGKGCDGSDHEQQGQHQKGQNHHSYNCTVQDGSGGSGSTEGQGDGDQQDHQSEDHRTGPVRHDSLHDGRRLPGAVVLQERRRQSASKLVVQVLVIMSVCLFVFSILTYTVVKTRSQNEGLIKVNSRTALYQPYTTY